MIGEAGELEAPGGRGNGVVRGRSTVLLGTDRRWLRSALGDVLSAEGFQPEHATGRAELEERAEEERPALVIVDEELPGLEVESTARSLVEGPLGHDTPLLLYTSSSAARVEEHVRALDAGFWDLLTDPLRPAQLTARMRRMLTNSRHMREAGRRGAALGGREASSLEFLTLEELGRILPAISALAEREESSVSIVLVTPTAPAVERDCQQEVAASLCGPNLRRADLCAWIDDAELAIVAYDTSVEEARSLVERLDSLVRSAPTAGREADPRLSAAIVELRPSAGLERLLRRTGRSREDAVDLDEIMELLHLQDARSALSDAREAGGGVRVVDVA